MSTIFDVMLIVLVLLCLVLLFRGVQKNNKQHNASDSMLSISDNEDHFDLLISKITPVFYWRVHNEYNDFIQTTIKKMTTDEIISQPDLFNAQRRCSDLNSAVYKYYENIKNVALMEKKSLFQILRSLICNSALMS